MDLDTNATKGVSRENALLLQKGTVPAGCRVVKMAQTFRFRNQRCGCPRLSRNSSLTNDDQVDPDETETSLYVLVNFRSGGYQAELADGLRCRGNNEQHFRPCRPFLSPRGCGSRITIYRLWVRQDDVASAHVDAAQNHTKSNYMRNPVAAENLQRGGVHLLKRKIKDNPHAARTTLTIVFDYAGEVTAEDAKQSLDKVATMYNRALEAAEKAHEAGASRSEPAPCGCSPRTCRRPSTPSSRTSLPAEPAEDRGRRP